MMLLYSLEQGFPKWAISPLWGRFYKLMGKKTSTKNPPKGDFEDEFGKPLG